MTCLFKICWIKVIRDGVKIKDNLGTAGAGRFLFFTPNWQYDFMKPTTDPLTEGVLFLTRVRPILMINAARKLGHLINRRTREFSDEDIQKIAQTYHNWCNPDDDYYEDVKGFCKSATVEEVAVLDYVLTPGQVRAFARLLFFHRSQEISK